MRKQKIWRVRVYRKIEDWVDVSADTPLQAEQQASILPGVLSIFSGLTIRGDKPISQLSPVGVVEDEDI